MIFVRRQEGAFSLMPNAPPLSRSGWNYGALFRLVHLAPTNLASLCRADQGGFTVRIVDITSHGLEYSRRVHDNSRPLPLSVLILRLIYNGALFQSCPLKVKSIFLYLWITSISDHVHACIIFALLIRQRVYWVFTDCRPNHNSTCLLRRMPSEFFPGHNFGECFPILLEIR